MPKERRNLLRKELKKRDFKLKLMQLLRRKERLKQLR
jgi:hypothetical protein